MSVESVAASAPAAPRRRTDATTRQIRGSTLLLAGRGISLGLNFLAQVMTVRYLSKIDYGALAYALAMVSVFARFSRLGMDKAASRFTAVDLERENYPRLFGSLLFMLGAIGLLGLGTIVAAWGFAALGGTGGVGNELALALLVTIIALAPLEAFDTLLQAVFAVFSKPKMIFFRKHVVGPLLKVLVVLVVMIAGGDVFMLAWANLVGGVLGLAVGASLLVHVLRERRLWDHFHWRGLKWPAREIIGFSVPMMVSDVVFVIRTTLVVVLLEHFHGNESVADYRAVLPVARLNRVVLDSFAFLFMPAMARLLVRDEPKALNDLFWRSTTWIAVLSFPGFALSACFAHPLTVLLFEERYETASGILAMLSLGVFVHATLELSGLALKSAGQVRRVMWIDGIAVALTLVLSLLLVPRFGAMGGAVGLAITFMLHSLMYQVGLARETPISLLPGRFTRVFLLIGALCLGLVAIELVVDPPIWIGAPLVVLASLVLIRSCRGVLEIEHTFPELLRLPVIGRWLAPPVSPAEWGRGTPGDQVDRITAELRASVAHHFGLGPGPVELSLASLEPRPASSVLCFDVESGRHRLSLLVKAPPRHLSPGDDGGAGTAQDAPRIGQWLDPAKIIRYEGETLRAIRQHLEPRGDSRFGTVPVVDLFEDGTTLVMERLPHPPLRSLLLHDGWRPGSHASERLLRASRHAGAWLRAFHALPRLPHTELRRTRRGEFVESLDEFTRFLILAGVDEAFLVDVVARTRRAAERVLPEELLCGMGHGDFAPRNILVGPGERVFVVDTPGRWWFPIYLDLAYFLTGVKTLGPRVMSAGLLVGDGLVDDVERALLEGYFEDQPVPREKIRVFEVKTLLSRWVSAVHDARRARGLSGKVRRRTALHFKERACRRQLEATLARLDPGS